MTAHERHRIVVDYVTRRYRHRARVQWQTTHKGVTA